MSPELGSPHTNREAVLLTFFAEDFENPKAAEWREVETATALWHTLAFYGEDDECKRVIAVRISYVGSIDSYCIDLDPPHEFAHFSADGQSSFSDTLKNIQAQREMDLITPNEDEQNQFDELIIAMKLQAEL